MLKSKSSQRDLDQFSRLILALKNKKIEDPRKFFSFKGPWAPSSLKSAIHAELVDPLFMKAGVNIKDEDDIPKHRKDNLVCCYEYFLRKLKRIENPNKLYSVLEEFRSCYEKIVSAANKQAPVKFPYSWMLDSPKSDTPLVLLDRQIEQKKGEKARFEKSLENFVDEDKETADAKRWSEVSEEIDGMRVEKYKRELAAERNINLAAKQINYGLMWIRTARGKAGRHPDPFNVLTYRVINKCTYWKLDKDREYVWQKDKYKIEKDKNGRSKRIYPHKLKRDWDLILFLILDIHFHVKGLPEIQRFISKYKNRPAREALRDLKNIFWDNYKHFPPLDGWSFPQRLYETSFRKLIVKDDGSLKIVSL
jgi:hypothetical protein